MSRCVAALIALAAAGGLAIADVADATPVTLRDDQGRPIQFDVRGGPVSDVNAYAGILRAMWHGDEIRDVVVQIGPATGGGGYYDRRGRITIPSDGPAANRQLIHHEYGHHLDQSHTGVDCGFRPCWEGKRRGGPRWYAARGLPQRARQGLLNGNSWETTLAEVWAEDYAAFHDDFDFYFIGWQPRPGEAARRAIASDLTAAGAAAGGGPKTFDPKPYDGGRASPGRNRFVQRGAWLVARRTGTLAPGRSVAMRFRGPRRALRYQARFFGGAEAVGNRLVCRGRQLTGAAGTPRQPAVITRRTLPRGLCTLRLVNTGATVAPYSATLRISRTRR